MCIIIWDLGETVRNREAEPVWVTWPTSLVACGSASAILHQLACMWWLCLQRCLHGNCLFGLVLPPDNTLAEHLTTPWQYTSKSLAVPWQYAGNTQALVGRVWMCGISPLTVTSLEQQQCMGSCQLLHEMHADTVRGASPWSRQLDIQEIEPVQARHKHEL